MRLAVVAAAAAATAATTEPASGFWGWLSSLGTSAEAYVLGLSETIWIYVGVYALSVIDGIFPVVPSESVVIASATTWAQTGRPFVWFIWLAAAAGAWCGDQITYTVGTLVNVRRIPGMNSKRGRATLDWAEHALEHRGTSFIIAARFIPGGRVAVNLTAGALRFPRRRFMGVDAIAGAIWATWGVALGIFAGSIFQSNLWLSVAVGVAGGVLLGFLVDKILSRVGIEPPSLPDIDQLPERHISSKKRAAEAERRERLKKKAPKPRD